MKSLETTEEMCKRLAQNPGLKLPYHECCESNPVTYVHCQNVRKFTVRWNVERKLTTSSIK
uniref:Uncharacterized protein n=1 Tax=Ciona intestinalis TaxID=7719 RepID=H2XTB2_CIOIN